MPAPDLLELFIAPLERNGIEYMISGSMATVFYGEPRTTLDIDIAVLLDRDLLAVLRSAFADPEYYVPPLPILESELRKAGDSHFNIIHIPSGLNGDFYPSRSHLLFQWALDHRRLVHISGLSIKLSPPEYVILWKLEFIKQGGGEKHANDIRGMLSVQQDSINASLLRDAVKELGLSAVWKQFEN